MRPIASFSAASIGSPNWIDQATVGHADTTLGVRTINGFNRVYTQTILGGGTFDDFTAIRTDHYLGTCLTKSYVNEINSSNDDSAILHGLSLDANSNLWFGGTAFSTLDVDPRPVSTATVTVDSTPELFASKWFNSIGLPLTASLFRGTGILTSLDRLQCSDDLYFQVAPGPVFGFEPSIQIEMTGSIDPLVSVVTLSATSEAKANLTGTTEKLFMYNYVSGTWEEVGSRSLSTSDAAHTYSPTGSLSRFVDTSGNFKARLAVVPPTNPPVRFVASIDHFRWHITN